MSLSWPAVVGTQIAINVGTLSAIGTGDFTIVVLVKPASTTGAGHLGLSTGSGYQYQIINDAGPAWFGGGDFSGFGSGTVNTTDWHVIGHGKTSGSNVYRWHYYNYSAGGAKTHADGSGTHANPGSITAITLGNADNRGNGLIAVAALWLRKITDAEFDALCTNKLQDWLSQTPDALLPCNVAASSLADVTGHGHDVASVTGTITLSGTDPSGVTGAFDYSLGVAGVTPTGIPIGVALGQPTVSAAISATPAGIAVPVRLGAPSAGDLSVIGNTANGGWYGLLSVLKERTETKRIRESLPPASCPHDGEPLQTDGRGGLMCRFDGWRWPQDGGAIR